MSPKIAQVVGSPESFRLLLRAQLDTLRESGFDVHCVAGEGDYLDLLARDGYAVHAVPLTRTLDPLADLRALARLTALFRRERFDLVHTHNPKAAVVAEAAARIARVPHVVTTLHGMLAHDETPRWLRLPLGLVDRLQCGLADRVLSQSAEDLERASRGVCDATKLLPLGQGIDLRRFDPARFPRRSRGPLRVSLGLPADGLVVGMVGRLSREKGFAEFFAMAREIAARDPRVHFLIVGLQIRERDPVDPDPRRHGLEGRLTVLLNQSDMPAMYSAMDLAVLPTYREGFPRALVEACAMGIPVVATNIRGCREAVAHGTTGVLVDPRDSAALTEATWRLLADEALRSRMTVACRPRAVAEFDERRVCARVVHLYRTLFGAAGNENGDAPIPSRQAAD